MRTLAATTLLTLLASTALPTGSPAAAPAPAASADSAIQVMVLASFHFAGSSGDAVEGTVVDMTTPQRQREIRSVVSSLMRFRPTKVAVEWPEETAAEFDSMYAAYRAGEHELAPNERQQLGFRLAERGGHAHIYPIDWHNSWDFESVMAHAEEHDPRFIAYFEQWRDWFVARDDSLARNATVGRWLRFYNLPETQAALFEPNVRMLSVGADSSHVGVEPTADLYERNLMIFSNLLKIAEPGDRIIVIFGGSHRPFLERWVKAYPGMEFVDPLDFL